MGQRKRIAHVSRHGSKPSTSGVPASRTTSTSSSSSSKLTTSFKSSSSSKLTLSSSLSKLPSSSLLSSSLSKLPTSSVQSSSSTSPLSSSSSLAAAVIKGLLACGKHLRSGDIRMALAAITESLNAIKSTTGVQSVEEVLATIVNKNDSFMDLCYRCHSVIVMTTYFADHDLVESASFSWAMAERSPANHQHRKLNLDTTLDELLKYLSIKTASFKL